ncbi:MAG: class I SAM-dependent methyltransferase [Anaerolineae bacterium]|nr:class I SAM-dependent methyltransferase [Anaerolineae bacterium]
MDSIDWIEQNLNPTPCTSAGLLYDHMDSQSGRSLPIIYQPFDVTDRGHWTDRGSLFDFLSTAGQSGGHILDFGPGDGWPSLILAPFVDRVTGVDGSQRRVEVCRENAARLGIDNATFIYVEPGQPLPYGDNTFDGIAAASSVEQTPDPYRTLQELHRVLRPEGKLRLSYEGLECYRGEGEFEAWLTGVGNDACKLVIYHRNVGGERVNHYGLTLAMPQEKARIVLTPDGKDITQDTLTVERLEQLRPSIAQASKLTLRHPSASTWLKWLDEIGFGSAQTTHCGAAFAWLLYDALSPERHPTSIDALDDLLRTGAQVATQLAAPNVLPGGRDPWITAAK